MTVEVGIGVALVVGASAAGARPPIGYSGELRTTTRAQLPENADDRLDSARSVRLRMNSYLWEPWFSTWKADINAVHTSSYGTDEPSNLGASGGARLEVFPRSRFPFALFGRVSDSRIDLDSGTRDDRDTFRARYGATQRYRTVDGRGQFVGTVSRDLQEASDGAETTRDRGIFHSTYRWTQHELNTNLNLTDERSDLRPGGFRELIADARHLYQPRDDLTVESFANINDRQTTTPGRRFELLQGIVNSVANWRPDGKPYRLDGRFRWQGIDQNNGNTSNQLATNVSGSYDYSDALRFNASLGASHSSSEDLSRTQTDQSLSASYTPAASELAGFTYSWFANGNASNRTDNDGSRQEGGTNLGHSIARALPLDANGTVVASFSLTESGGVSGESELGSQLRLVHSVSLGLARTVPGASTVLTFTATDNRGDGVDSSFSALDTVFQSANLFMNHQADLGRYSRWGANAAFGYTSQTFDRGEKTTNSFSQAALTYTNSRLFSIRRLRLRSELRANANSLVFVGEPSGDDRYNLRWETEANYSIGLVRARLKATLTKSDENQDAAITFTLVRAFGGVL